MIELKLLPYLFRFLVILLFLLKTIISVYVFSFCMSLIALLERKILGYIQYCEGPNKFTFIGLMQPFSDAVKLFAKKKLNYFINSQLNFPFH